MCSPPFEFCDGGKSIFLDSLSLFCTFPLSQLRFARVLVMDSFCSQFVGICTIFLPLLSSLSQCPFSTSRAVRLCWGGSSWRTTFLNFLFSLSPNCLEHAQQPRLNSGANCGARRQILTAQSSKVPATRKELSAHVFHIHRLCKKRIRLLVNRFAEVDKKFTYDDRRVLMQTANYTLIG